MIGIVQFFLDQFISSFAFAYVLSILAFDADWFIHITTKGFDQMIQWNRDIRVVFNSWKSKIKIYVEVDYDDDICVD